MALHYDFTKVEDADALADTEAGINEAIVWLSMGVNLHGISEDNVDEFCVRAAFLQALFGPYLSHGIYVTDEMIRRRVGLTTNVGHEDRESWMERQLRNFDGPAKRLMDKQRERSAEIMASLQSEDAEV